MMSMVVYFDWKHILVVWIRGQVIYGGRHCTGEKVSLLSHYLSLFLENWNSISLNYPTKPGLDGLHVFTLKVLPKYSVCNEGKLQSVHTDKRDGKKFRKFTSMDHWLDLLSSLDKFTTTV